MSKRSKPKPSSGRLDSLLDIFGTEPGQTASYLTNNNARAAAAAYKTTNTIHRKLRASNWKATKFALPQNILQQSPQVMNIGVLSTNELVVYVDSSSTIPSNEYYIVIYNAKGEMVGRWGVENISKMVVQEDNIYALNGEESTIIVYNLDGSEYVIQLRESHNQQKLFHELEAFTIANDEIFILDMGHIYVFDMEGYYVRHFPMVNTTGGIAIEGNYLFVSHSHFIGVYNTQTGALISRIGSRGANDLQFEDPYELAILSNKYNIIKIAVVDTSNTRIQIINFDTDTNDFTFDKNIDLHMTPDCIAVKDNRLYICEGRTTIRMIFLPVNGRKHKRKTVKRKSAKRKN